MPRQQVTAQVILRKKTGESILDADVSLTSENIGEYAVEQQVVQEAVARLTALGFTVAQAGPHSLSISSDRALFEQVFGTELALSDEDPGKTAMPTGTGAFYEARKPIAVPADLRSLIAGVVLPTPPELFP